MKTKKQAVTWKNSYDSEAGKRRVVWDVAADLKDRYALKVLDEEEQEGDLHEDGGDKKQENASKDSKKGEGDSGERGNKPLDGEKEEEEEKTKDGTAKDATTTLADIQIIGDIGDGDESTAASLWQPPPACFSPGCRVEYYSVKFQAWIPSVLQVVSF